MKLWKFAAVLNFAAADDCEPGLSNTVDADGHPLPDGEENG